MTDTLTLSELLTRRLSLHWYEGIAIVGGVVERLVEQQSPGTRMPEPHQIELGADGSVTLAGGIPVDEPVRRLGQLLQALLTDADVPVQLRLIVSQATAPIPSYSSLPAFAQALAYFEPPNRAELLHALFARAQAAGPATPDDVALMLDNSAPRTDGKATAPVARRHRTNSRRLIRTVASLTAVLALSAAALWVRTRSQTVTGHKVSRATGATIDAVGAAVLAGVSAVSDRVGLGRFVPAGADSTSPAPPAAVPSTRRPTARSVVAPLEPVQAGVEHVPPRQVVGYETAERASLIGGLSQLAKMPDQSTEATIPVVIYKTDAEGVSPPVAVRPQLRRQLPPMVNRADLSRIELVIAPDGSVESAKLLGDRRDVRGGMFLSAVKAWQFRPATKDGVAVRYRTMIQVSFE